VALLSVGHGTLDEQALGDLLVGAGVELLVDVRRFPASRRLPHVNRGELERWLPERGVAYRWAEDLGGRRQVQPGSRHVALRNDSFRAYADHMDTPAFRVALDGLLVEAAGGTTTVMCSEALWWRCHRRLLADAAVLLGGSEVLHLYHDGRQTTHEPTREVRVEAGRLSYDLGGQQELPGVG
jgi:uncharacterized protein (DUF488 family)